MCWRNSRLATSLHRLGSKPSANFANVAQSRLPRNRLPCDGVLSAEQHSSGFSTIGNGCLVSKSLEATEPQVIGDGTYSNPSRRIWSRDLAQVRGRSLEVRCRVRRGSKGSYAALACRGSDTAAPPRSPMDVERVEALDLARFSIAPLSRDTPRWALAHARGKPVLVEYPRQG